MICRDQLDRLGRSLAVVATLLRIAEYRALHSVRWMDLAKSSLLLWKRTISVNGLDAIVIAFVNLALRVGIHFDFSGCTVTEFCRVQTRQRFLSVFFFCLIGCMERSIV